MTSGIIYDKWKIYCNNNWHDSQLSFIKVFITNKNIFHADIFHHTILTQITRFTGPTWGPPGSCRPQVGPMLTPWTMLSGNISHNLLTQQHFIPFFVFVCVCVCVLCDFPHLSDHCFYIILSPVRLLNPQTSKSTTDVPNLLKEWINFTSQVRAKETYPITYTLGTISI